MKVITLIWLWWQERNRVREGEKRRSAGDLAFIAASQATEYLSLYKHEEKNVVAAKQKWKRPGQEWLKVNSDGAFSADRGEGGWGVVIRDAEGGLAIAEAGRLPNALNALHAETLACLAGVKLAIDQGIGRLIIETDSLILKQVLADSSYRLATMGGLICELQYLISTSFISHVINFVPRCCNKVAHALAALRCKCPQGDMLHWESTLTEVEDLVASNIAESIS
jgi:hypothetical protein